MHIHAFDVRTPPVAAAGLTAALLKPLSGLAREGKGIGAMTGYWEGAPYALLSFTPTYEINKSLIFSDIWLGLMTAKISK